MLLGGRYSLVERVEQERVYAAPARYRLTLRHPDGRKEEGAFRRFRADAPAVGNQFTTLENGAPISWAVVEQYLAHDAGGDPFLESIAERDYAEAESLPDHELEHALERDNHDDTAAAAAMLSRAAEARLAIELVGLEAGQAPDWQEASSYLESLILEEEEPGLTSPALGPRLFLCRPFRGRQSLETLVRDRGAALDRQAVCPGGETLLSTLECVESLAELVGQGFVELVEVEARREVRRLLPAGILAVVLVDAMSESVLNFTPFRGEQLPSAFRVHQFTLPISAAREGTRRTTSQSSAGSTSA
jgi:hypothetical protein